VVARITAIRAAYALLDTRPLVNPMPAIIAVILATTVVSPIMLRRLSIDVQKERRRRQDRLGKLADN